MRSERARREGKGVGLPAGAGACARLSSDWRCPASAGCDRPDFETDFRVSDRPVHGECGVGRGSSVQPARAATCIFLLGSAGGYGWGNCSAGARSDELRYVADRYDMAAAAQREAQSIKIAEARCAS